MRSVITLMVALLLSVTAHNAFAFTVTPKSAPSVEPAPPSADKPAGILLTKIYPDTSAEKAGLMPGDIVTRVNGLRITRLIEWNGALQSNGGKTMELTIFRDHYELTVSLYVPLIKPGSRISGNQPSYPFEAKLKHVTGMVTLHAIISPEGKITDLTVVSGPEELQKAATDAVKKWKYNPYTEDGKPIAVETTITVNFAMGSR